MIWLMIGYMWMEIHRPFEIWTLLARYHVERVYVILTIVYWLRSGPALPRNRLHWRFASFVLVMLLSWLTSPCGSAGDGTVEYYLKYVVFYVLLVTSVRNERDLRTIIAGYLAVMALLMVHSLREFYCGNALWEQGLLRLVPVGHSYDFNDFAGLIVCSLPFAWVLWRQASGWRQRAPVCGYFALAAYCTVLTGSRMGFAGMVLASLLGCLASPRRWRLLALYPVALVAAWAILPEGAKDRYTTLIDPEHVSAGGTTAENFRYRGFEEGLKMFEQRPLAGFGPNSYGVIGHHGAMAHNLYGQLLGELGIAGAVAFGAILFGVAGNSLEALRILRRMGNPDDLLPRHTIAAATATFVLLVIMSWGFNFLFWYVWLWFGSFQVIALRCLERQAESAKGGGLSPLEPETGKLGS
jgi:hypothetical protein